LAFPHRLLFLEQRLTDFLDVEGPTATFGTPQVAEVELAVPELLVLEEALEVVDLG
jgi:hypothetical protein